MNSIGERIVFLREERDMSQKHLAYTIGRRCEIFSVNLDLL